MNASTAVATSSDIQTDIPVAGAGNLAPVPVQFNLRPINAAMFEGGSGRVAEIVAKKPLAAMTPQEYTLFGSARQQELGRTLSAMLSGVDAQSSPEVFRLFQELKKGVKDLNLEELQEKIRKSVETKWWHRILDALHLSSVADRIAKAGEIVGQLVTEKTKNLNQLVERMETDLDAATRKLIEELTRIGIMAKEHRTNIVEFGVVAAAGYELLAAGRAEEQRLIAIAKESGDPLKIQDARDFQRKLQTFENRVMLLHIAYAKAPVELETMGMLEGSTVQVLSETAVSSMEEFNDIKSALLKLVVLYKISNVQQLNKQRRELRDVLAKYNLSLMEDTAVKAASAMGDNRLEDALLLLSYAQGVASIGDKVEAAYAQNGEKFARAREVLGDTKKLMDKLSDPAAKIPAPTDDRPVLQQY